MILSGGANIYPAELEAALMEHPRRRVAVVIGLPHEDLGAAVHAIVKPHAGRRLDQPNSRASSAKGWRATRRPRSYEFTTDSLRDDAGKVPRTQLRRKRRARLIGQAAQQDAIQARERRLDVARRQLLQLPVARLITRRPAVSTSQSAPRARRDGKSLRPLKARSKDLPRGPNLHAIAFSQLWRAMISAHSSICADWSAACSARQWASSDSTVSRRIAPRHLLGQLRKTRSLLQGLDAKLALVGKVVVDCAFRDIGLACYRARACAPRSRPFRTPAKLPLESRAAFFPRGARDVPP
jgi:hypothetical protein